jgi:hypothetical protein
VCQAASLLACLKGVVQDTLRLARPQLPAWGVGAGAGLAANIAG